jgi:hypothetical protein
MNLCGFFAHLHKRDVLFLGFHDSPSGFQAQRPEQRRVDEKVQQR